jgi:antirestriction protein ArdC
MANVNLSSLQSAKHAHVAEVIINAIEKGAGKFEMPWHAKKGPLRRPANVATGTTYRGVNIVTLWVEQEDRGLSSNLWATYRQWQDLGAQVRQGERSTPVVFTSLKEVEDAIEGEKEPQQDDKLKRRRKFISKWYSVFNADQVEDWQSPHPAYGPETPLMPSAEKFIQTANATVIRTTGRACYRSKDDVIECPPLDQFNGSSTSTALESYYATLLHEHVHWTGHESRLNRPFGKSMEDEVYAQEELVAELGSAFLCADLDVTNEPRPDHAAYVATWLKQLKQHPLSLFIAASKAERAVTFLHDLDELKKLVA